MPAPLRRQARQLGRELVLTLERYGRIVQCVRRSQSASGSEDITAVDFTNNADLRNLVREVHPNLIVNAAAYTAVDAAERDGAIAMAVNGIAPGVLAEEAARIGSATRS